MCISTRVSYRVTHRCGLHRCTKKVPKSHTKKMFILLAHFDFQTWSHNGRQVHPLTLGHFWVNTVLSQSLSCVQQGHLPCPSSGSPRAHSPKLAASGRPETDLSLQVFPKGDLELGGSVSTRVPFHGSRSPPSPDPHRSPCSLLILIAWPKRMAEAPSAFPKGPAVLPPPRERDGQRAALSPGLPQQGSPPAGCTPQQAPQYRRVFLPPWLPPPLP